MATSYEPAYPVVGDTVEIVSTSGAEELALTQYALTSVPPGSALEVGVIVDAAGLATNSFAPDVVGEYAFKETLFTEFAATAVFDGHDGGQTYQVAASSSTFTVYVGTALDFVIAGPDGHSTTLRLVVQDGVVSNASLVLPTTQLASYAASDATVAAAVSAIESISAASIGPSLVAEVTTLLAKYKLHRTQAGVHDTNDTLNLFVGDAPYSQEQAIVALGKFAKVLRGHLTGASLAGVRWHGADDTKNAPVTSAASSLAQAIVLYADLAWRGFERHLSQTASPGSHAMADATNTLGTIDNLSAVIVAFLDFVSSETVTTPTGVETGEVDLTTLYGFTRA